jgi:hypothetical protein
VQLEENQKTCEKVAGKLSARMDHLQALQDAEDKVNELRAKRSKRTAAQAAAATAAAAAAVPMSTDDGLSSAAEDVHLALTKRRLDRIFVDHLLREGLYNTAQGIVNESKLNVWRGGL